MQYAQQVEGMPIHLSRVCALARAQCKLCNILVVTREVNMNE